MKQGGRRGSGPAVFGDARAMGGVCRHPLSAGIEGGSERARLDEEREMRRDSQTKERGGERENQILLRCIRRRMIENREIWLCVFLIVCGYSMRLVGDLSAHPLTQSSNPQTSLSNLFFFSFLSVLLP